MDSMNVFSDTINDSFGYFEITIGGSSFLLDPSNSLAVKKLEKILEQYQDHLAPVMYELLKAGGLNALRNFSRDNLNLFCKKITDEDLERLGYDVFTEEYAQLNHVIFNLEQYSIKLDSNGLCYLECDGNTDCPEQPLNVSTTYMMFSGYASAHLDLSSWDVSRVEVMDCMFYQSDGLTGLNLNNWDTRSLESANSMFMTCDKLRRLCINNWDMGNVTDVTDMFAYCIRLSELNLSKWQLHDSCHTNNMFRECITLQTTHNAELDKILEETR